MERWRRLPQVASPLVEFWRRLTQVVLPHSRGESFNQFDRGQPTSDIGCRSPARHCLNEVRTCPADGEGPHGGNLGGACGDNGHPQS